MAAEAGRERITRELLFAAFAGPSAQTDDPRLLERITSSIEAQTVAPGDVVFREGDESKHVYFMSEGRMRLSRTGHPDWVYDGRWVVGTTDVLVGRPRARTATMETAARLFRLPSERWFEVMRQRPEVILNALVGFARGVSALYARLAPDGGFGGAGEARRVDISTLAARTRLLAALPLFQGLSMQILVEMADLAETRELAPGQPLFGTGEPGRLFVVSAGRIEATRVAPDVRGVFSAGSLVGGAACLGDVESTWSARALDASQVISIAIDDLFDRIEEHQESIRAMMAALALERDALCEELAARIGELVLQ